MGPGVWACAAAEGQEQADKNAQPADIGRRCRLGDALVERSRTGADDIATSAGFAETTRAKPDHHARHATVAYDQIGANADDVDRNLIRQMLKEIGEVIFIRWREQQLRRTADPKPRQLGQRLVLQQPSAQLRHRGFEIGRDVGEGHAYLLDQLISSSPGSLSPFPPPLW